ncbi:ParB/RepB/Spo0J family partition protein [Arthrobacter sp. Br18]|uniref:ParB/RepB/Spo0J family partition protein n=1 Tax=Arthrobacter sp. Br18 TaxID=1312954 RepID=UPI000478E15B|nr:ParB/RepB/Spo0J family partition protein [Arthrobacter sp. Br18]
MVEKRRGLGRGLGALIPSAPVEEAAPVEVESRRAGSRPADLFFEASRNHQEALRQQARQDGADGVPSEKDASTTLRSKTRSTPRTSVPSLKAGKAARAVIGGSDDKTAVSRETKEDVPGGAEKAVSNGESHVEPPASLVEKVVPDFEAGVPATETDGAIAEDSVVVPGIARNGSVSRETVTHTASAAPGESPGALVEVPGAQFAELPIDSIHANRKQPRQEFDADELAELAHSIREVGVLQPIVVRPSQENGATGYELVMGERRWRATREAGLTTVPAIIRLTGDDDLLRDALLENLHRSSLNPLEEAAAYQQLLDDFGCSHEELSGRIGRSRPQISNTLRLLKLPPLVQRRVAAGIISAGHARALLGLADQAEMEKLAQRIVAEGLSVRSTEEIVAMSDGLRRPARESTPKAGARHERLDYLASSLSDRLDTSVKITLGARKGKVSIEFASVDDLNRIMGVLAPTEN